jgi:2-haloacid dehalogenase
MGILRSIICLQYCNLSRKSNPRQEKQKMSITLAYDVYGTLIDTRGIVAELQKFVGGQAPEFSRTRRDKQLEYSFRRGLMRAYADFADCTSNALDYTNSLFRNPLGDQSKKALLQAYKTLPAFADAREGLIRAAAAGFKLFAFSNGSAVAVHELLTAAGIRELFADIVSVEEVGSFKPDPAVYLHFLQKAQAPGTDAWLVSGNPFDVIGAISSGMRAAWVQRSPDAVFDPWGMEPTITVSNLIDLPDQILRKRNEQTHQACGLQNR